MRECFTFLCSKCGKSAEQCKCAEREVIVQCVRCGNILDSCSCTCPYCGERAACECATGYCRATGG